MSAEESAPEAGSKAEPDISPALTLFKFIRDELERKQPAAVRLAADTVRERFGGHVLAVLFYGACLRTGEVEDNLLDFYVIVDDYRQAYGPGLLALGNRLLPPNVFYSEINTGAGAGDGEGDGEGDGAGDGEGDGAGDDGSFTLRSKYAVLSLGDFLYRTSTDCLNVSVWARFSQPAALIDPASAEVAEALTGAVAEAAKTMISAAMPLLPDLAGPRQVWETAFGLTYSAELRSEKSGKGGELYDLDAARYRAITPLIFAALGEPSPADPDGSPARIHPGQSTPGKARRKWLARRINGKFASFFRLLKAAFTFDGGIDYLAWKIKRHSGVEIAIKPWQRRHPILAGLLLFLRLRLKGAFR